MMLCVVAMKLGSLALMFAAMNGHVAVVDYLLECGAQADLVDYVSPAVSIYTIIVWTYSVMLILYWTYIPVVVSCSLERPPS